MDLLFDLDGTLTNSAPGILRCFAHALDHVGFGAKKALLAANADASAAHISDVVSLVAARA